jgi:tRNA-dihydrouridine synthase B
MAGITNPPFRRLCKELGAAFAVTELVSCHAVVYLAARERNRSRPRGAKTLSLMEPYPGERPFFVQLYGREPEIMAEASRIVASEGADVVDLNFGCPARKVIKNGEGCGVALMRDPPTLGAIASSVVRAIDVPVTAKIRLGWSASEKNAVEVARVLEGAGVQAICVHARTREQGHSGPTDLESLAAVVAAVRIPVVGNGGIRSREDAERMRASTGCARVAVGQGAKGNPWIFREIAGGPGAPSLGDRISLCRRHLDLFAEWAGGERAAIEMRKHACWYLRGFDGAAAFRKRLGEAVDVATFHRLLDELPAG